MKKEKLSKILFIIGLLLIFIGVLLRFSGIIINIETYKILFIVLGFMLMLWALFGMKKKK